MQYLFHTLPNGIRIVHRHSDMLVGHMAVMINTGSRDENPGEEGLAHFIEHVIFKGTTKRRLHQVLGHLENIGADLNAYTTKEETCIHASFLNTFYPRAIDLFADILFNSTFPEKEIAKEKKLSIADVAKRMGIQAPALSRIINGSNTTTDTLQKIADALEVSISELFETPQASEFTCPNCGTRLTVSKK